jgi:hypothetical protein
MTRDELLKRVARTICQNPPICACDDMRISCCSEYAHETACAAINIVLEEAARVAESLYPRGSAHTYASENADRYIAQEDTCESVASEIRALKSGDGE